MADDKLDDEEIEALLDDIDALPAGDELQSDAEERDADQDRFLDSLLALTLAMLSRFHRLVREEVLEANDGNEFTVTDAQRVASRLSAILQEAGLDNVMTAYEQVAADIAESAAEAYAPMGLDAAELSDEEREMYLDIADAVQQELRTQIESRVIGPTAQALTGGVIGGLTATQIVRQLRSLEVRSLDGTRIQAAIDDGLSQLFRTGIILQGRAQGLQVYLFLGPLDERTCPICQKILEDDRHGLKGAYYLDEIVEMGLTPATGGGHFRCRHMWVGLTEQQLREAGFRFRE